MKVLNVAEKPSVCKEVTAILSQGRFSKRPGLSETNWIYEFPCQFQGQSVEMVFTSVRGHLMGLDYPEQYKHWNSCDPMDLFEAPVQKSITEGMEGIEKTLKREARSCQALILWLDCDREGENIAFEVLEVCRSANNRLQVYRAHFSALIPNDIWRALQTVTPPNINDSMAVDARQEVDLRIGAAFTRFQTMRLQNKFSGLSESVISYGPCQFPTLGFVVDRYWKIQKFVPEDFWYIKCSVQRQEGTANFEWHRVRLFDRMACFIVYEMCCEHPQATVVDTKSKPTKKYRPFPLTTVELQKLSARKLHIASEETMKIAESLYQNGYISYPRTETDCFQDGTDFHSIIANQIGDNQWGAYADKLLNQGKFRTPKKGKHNDNSHPPIHPTKHADNLSGKSKSLYDFITRHFLACCSDDAHGWETTVTIDINGEQFSTSGLAIHELNWLEVYPYDKWSDRNIPVFKPNETFTPTSLTMEQGTTTAPSLLTEAELIALMDKNGIGTDATIAQHIQTIQERGYATKMEPGAHFAPTTLGVALVDAYNSMGLELSLPNLRAEMEADMLTISKGNRSKDDIVKHNVKRYRDIFARINREAAKLDKALSKYFDPVGRDFVSETTDFTACGKCDSLMSLRMSADNNRMLFCATCDSSYSLPRSGDISPYNHRCPICNFQVVSIQKEDGKKYNCCPQCRNNPPPDQIPQDQSSARAFNCFSCSFTGCPLATRRSEDPVKLCHVCSSSHLVVKKKKDGSGFFLGCKNFPTCKGTLFLPDGVMELSTTKIPCHKCPQAFLLNWVFRKNSLPLGVPNKFEACIGCDETLHELMANTAPVSRAVPTSSVQSVNRPPQNASTKVSSTSLSTSYSQLHNGLSSDNQGNTASYQSGSNSYNNSHSSNNYMSNVQQSSGAPTCPGHGLPCSLRTVVREGPNKGRQFYTCPKPQDEQCENSFQWADGQSTTSSYQRNQSGAPSSSSGSVCYNCNTAGHFAKDCPQNGTKTAGGKWKKSASPKNGFASKKQYHNSPKKGFSPKGSSAIKSMVGDKKSRKCGMCGQEGHTKRNCPNA